MRLPGSSHLSSQPARSAYYGGSTAREGANYEGDAVHPGERGEVKVTNSLFRDRRTRLICGRSFGSDPSLLRLIDHAHEWGDFRPTNESNTSLRPPICANKVAKGSAQEVANPFEMRWFLKNRMEPGDRGPRTEMRRKIDVDPHYDVLWEFLSLQSRH